MSSNVSIRVFQQNLKKMKTPTQHTNFKKTKKMNHIKNSDIINYEMRKERRKKNAQCASTLLIKKRYDFLVCLELYIILSSPSIQTSR